MTATKLGQPELLRRYSGQGPELGARHYGQRPGRATLRRDDTGRLIAVAVVKDPAEAAAIGVAAARVAQAVGLDDIQIGRPPPRRRRRPGIP